MPREVSRGIVVRHRFIMTEAATIRDLVRRQLEAVPIVDIHTHLYDPAQNGLLLNGIDEMLNYHYHVAELFRVRPDLDPDVFWGFQEAARSNLIWREVFQKRSPLSDVGRGLLHVLQALGLNPQAESLTEAREFFRDHTQGEMVDRVLQKSNVKTVVMTNDPLDAAERATWTEGFDRDPRFLAALRLDSAIMDWPKAVPDLKSLGYDVHEAIDDGCVAELRRYLRDWSRRMDVKYMAVSLPPRLDYPGGSAPWLELLTRVVLPTAEELGLPAALMIGVRRQVNPRLRLAGDSLGKTDVDSLERLARDFPGVRFLVTLLSRESQHELCVAARKMPNILPFGCWWFTNNQSIAREITAMRLDMLGPSFIPQHSDARVLEQVLYKWQRSREWLLPVLAERYLELQSVGGLVSEATLRRDFDSMFGGGLLFS